MSLNEKTKRHTGPAGVEVLTEELESEQAEYQSLCEVANKTIATLELTSQQWTEFEELYKQLEHWLKDTNTKVKNETKLRANIENKKSAQEKCVVSIHN